MRQENRFERLAGGSEGKGTFGCVFSILVLAVGIFAGSKLIPLKYAASSFETDIKTEIARAGANFFSDETLVKEIILLAKRNEIRITAEQVKVERLAGQIQVTVNWTEPVDFVVFKYDAQFEVKASSYIGRL